MKKKSISISKEQVYWLKEMWGSYESMVEGCGDEGMASELKNVRKHAVPLIKELERITNK